MTRQPVQSSSLQSVGYDAETECLKIEFRSGRVYQYFYVPEEVYRELLNAPSKGTFFNQAIRDHYEEVTIR